MASVRLVHTSLFKDMLVIGYLFVLAFIATFSDGYPVRDFMLYPEYHHQGMTDFSQTRNLITSQLLKVDPYQQMHEYQPSDRQDTHYIELRKVI